MDRVAGAVIPDARNGVRPGLIDRMNLPCYPRRHYGLSCASSRQYYQYPLHTSLLEGIMNKIKVIKRMAYGFRDDDYFFLKIRAAFPGIPG